MNIIIEGTRDEAHRELNRLSRIYDGNIAYVGLFSQDEKKITYLVQQTEKDRPRQRTILQHRIFETQDSMARDSSESIKSSTAPANSPSLESNP